MENQAGSAYPRSFAPAPGWDEQLVGLGDETDIDRRMVRNEPSKLLNLQRREARNQGRLPLE
jgi:hypothetical protein